MNKQIDFLKEDTKFLMALKVKSFQKKSKHNENDALYN